MNEMSGVKPLQSCRVESSTYRHSHRGSVCGLPEAQYLHCQKRNTPLWEIKCEVRSFITIKTATRNTYAWCLHSHSENPSQLSIHQDCGLADQSSSLAELRSGRQTVLDARWPRGTIVLVNAEFRASNSVMYPGTAGSADVSRTPH